MLIYKIQTLADFLSIEKTKPTSLIKDLTQHLPGNECETTLVFSEAQTSTFHQTLRELHNLYLMAMNEFQGIEAHPLLKSDEPIPVDDTFRKLHLKLTVAKNPQRGFPTQSAAQLTTEYLSTNSSTLS